MSEQVLVTAVKPGDRINHGGGYEVVVTAVKTYRTVTEIHGYVWGGPKADVIRLDNAVHVTRLAYDEELTAWGIMRDPPRHVPSGEQAEREAR